MDVVKASERRLRREFGMWLPEVHQKQTNSLFYVVTLLWHYA